MYSNYDHLELWVAEQFCADLQKCFPRLGVKACSSNKLLGLFGQELPTPAIGFPFTSRTLHGGNNPIVIIVSHSGGTFAPLACSNLLQSFSSSIFVVTSEWDTQIGKQLRSMVSRELYFMCSSLLNVLYKTYTLICSSYLTVWR